MPNVRAFRSGNWSDTNPATSPWGTGGVLYSPASNDDVYANSFTVTVDNSPTVNLVTTASTSSVAWKDGGSAAATAGGGFTLKPNQTLTATVTPGATTSCLTFADAGSTYVVGTINASATNLAVHGIVNNSLTGTVFVTGNVAATVGGTNAIGILNSAGGVINVTGNVLGSSGTAIRNAGSGTIIVTGPVEAGLGASGFGHGINNVAAGTIQVVGNVTASSNLPAISSTNASSVVRVSGSFIHAVNGQVPIASNRVLLNTTPTLAFTRYAVNGTGTYFDMFTADNTGLGPATGNVRAGVSYGGGLVGSCAVPAAGSVALGVPVDAGYGTAVLTPEAVWGAASRTITGGTVDTLANAPASVTPSDIWSHATRTITGGTVTTLTNAPSVPSAASIASQVRTELSVELARVDAAITTRATPANIPSADITAIKAKTDAVNVDRINNTATLSQVGNLLAQANS